MSPAPRGSFGPSRREAVQAAVASAVSRPLARWVGRWFGWVDREHREWGALRQRLVARLDAGEPAFVLGVTAGTHEASVAVVRADAHRVELIANLEEERFTRRKHEPGFPTRALAEALACLPEGATPEVVGSWDLPAFAALWAGHVAEHFPKNLPALLRPETDLVRPGDALSTPRRLAAALGVGRRPVVGLPHHENHAWGAVALSPFAGGADPVLALVIDGTGDAGATSAFLARGDTWTDLGLETSVTDSLGLLYQAISAGQGGWAPLSSEGRFMGAAAWGDRSRETNPVYRRLRALLELGPEGRIRVDRDAARWHRDPRDPYGGWLRDTLGPPVPPERRWDPDAVLDPERTDAPALTRARLDEAAALQCLFEDAVEHLVAHLLRRTGATRMVWAGGAALNCVASLRLLETFDAAWTRTHLGVDGGLRLWVPTVPADAGVAAGAALQAFRGLGPRPVPLRHAFLMGRSPTTAAIRSAVADLSWRDLGDDLPAVAGRLADWIARGGVLGLVQGPAETGPRALGHRSILADPTRADALSVLNARVKKREAVRPLAPMVTRAAAEALFVLPPGAAEDDFAAFDFMVLCARARPGTADRVPAVVHRDGTARLQIVRPEVDPFTHAYLRAMGRRVGVEVSVNTSLNVGEPIAHTPEDAVRTLRRARDLHGLLLIGDDGRATVAFRPDTPAGDELRRWLDAP